MSESCLGNHVILDLFDIKTLVFESRLNETTFSIFDDYIKNSLKKNNMTLLN